MLSARRKKRPPAGEGRKPKYSCRRLRHLKNELKSRWARRLHLAEAHPILSGLHEFSRTAGPKRQGRKTMGRRNRLPHPGRARDRWAVVGQGRRPARFFIKFRGPPAPRDKPGG